MHQESKAGISLLYNLLCGEMLLGKDAIEKVIIIKELEKGENRSARDCLSQRYGRQFYVALKLIFL
jgi:hypothetical protein